MSFTKKIKTTTLKGAFNLILKTKSKIRGFSIKDKKTGKLKKTIPFNK